MLKFRQLPPHPSLKDIIRGYWLLEAGSEPTALDLIPDGYPEWFFSLKHRLSCRVSKGPWQCFPAAGFIGQLTGTFAMEIPAGTRLLSVKLYPQVSQALLGLPAWELNDQVQELEALTASPDMRALTGQIGAAANFGEMKLVLDDFFFRKLRDQPALTGSPFLRLAVHKIFESSGTAPLDLLTGRTLASRRYLEKQFKTQIGLTPKQYARIVRVKKASICLLDCNYQGNLASIGASLEYFDQSHFLKDFKAIVGSSPTAFLHARCGFPLDRMEAYLRQWDYS